MRTFAVAIALLLLTGCWESDTLLLSERRAARPLSIGTYFNIDAGENVAVSRGDDGWYNVGDNRVLFNDFGRTDSGMPGYAYAARESDGRYAYGIIFMGENGEIYEHRPSCDLSSDADVARRAGADVREDDGVCRFSSASSLVRALRELWEEGPVTSSPAYRRVLSASAPAQSSTGSIYRDAAGNEVTYSFNRNSVEFTSTLPAGWTFAVNLDGNQDGAWAAREGSDTSPDRSFGQLNGVFCPTYLFSANPGNPGLVDISSPCGGYRSNGDVELRVLDAQSRRQITLTVPSRELFGDNRSAHLQVCVWDGSMNTCQYTPQSPYILQRPR